MKGSFVLFLATILSTTKAHRIPAVKIIEWNDSSNEDKNVLPYRISADYADFDFDSRSDFRAAAEPEDYSDQIVVQFVTPLKRKKRARAQRLNLIGQLKSMIKHLENADYSERDENVGDHLRDDTSKLILLDRNENYKLLVPKKRKVSVYKPQPPIALRSHVETRITRPPPSRYKYEKILDY